MTTTSQSEEIVQSQQPGELKNIKSTYKLDGKKITLNGLNLFTLC